MPDKQCHFLLSSPRVSDKLHATAVRTRLNPREQSTRVLSEAGRGAAWLARLTGGQEVAGSNPVAPTPLDRKPFDENVEGLSHFVA